MNLALLKAKLVAWVYSAGIMLVIGLSIGGVGAWTIQGWRLDSLRADYRQIIEMGKAAEAKNKADVKRSQERADAYYENYLYIQSKRDEDLESARRALQTATSNTAVCFSPDATRMFNVLTEADSRGQAKGSDTRKPARSRSSNSSTGTGLVYRPTGSLSIPANSNKEEQGFNAISERAMADWKLRVTEQYNALRLKHKALSSIVEASDAFEIDRSR